MDETEYRLNSLAILQLRPVLEQSILTGSFLSSTVVTREEDPRRSDPTDVASIAKSNAGLVRDFASWRPPARTPKPSR